MGTAGVLAYGAIRASGRGLATIAQGHAPLAQFAEQQTLNLRVRGSSPWRRTCSHRPGVMQIPGLFQVRAVMRGLLTASRGSAATAAGVGAPGPGPPEAHRD